MEDDVKRGDESSEKGFNPHDVDKLYNDIVENVKIKRIERAQRAVSEILMISLYASLLAILFASCRIIYFSYGFGPALIFFALPVIINQNKFQSMKFLWKAISYVLFAMAITYGMFLSLTKTGKDLSIIWTALAAASAIMLIFIVLIILMAVQDRKVGNIIKNENDIGDAQDK